MHTKLLLLADHDKLERKALLKALKPLKNSEVREASTCTEVRNWIAKEKFDCIILDYLLPDCDTLSLVENLRDSGLTTPIIITTDHGDELVAVKFIKAGVQDYIPKNKITSSILTNAVSNAIDSVEKDRKGMAVLQNLHEKIMQKIAQYDMPVSAAS